jgi:hypothetical protein
MSVIPSLMLCGKHPNVTLSLDLGVAPDNKWITINGFTLFRGFFLMKLFFLNISLDKQS